LSNAPGPVIRRATAADAAGAADVYIRARHHATAGGTIPPLAHADDDVRQYFARVLIPTRETWIAVGGGGGGETIGILVLDGDDVDQLYLAPGCTGQGLGTRLLDLAKGQRPDGLQLWTFQTNVGAQRFYRRHGFIEMERTDGSGNEERAPDIRYRWRPVV
jgi:ribosomal protein S18 acetylase RimI-like enzyme